MNNLPNLQVAKELGNNTHKVSWSTKASRVRRQAIELGYAGDTRWPATQQRYNEWIKLIQNQTRKTANERKYKKNFEK